MWLFSVLFSICQFKAWHLVLKLSISFWEKNLSPLCVAEGAAATHPSPFYLWLVSLLMGISLSNASRGITLCSLSLYSIGWSTYWLCWTFCIGKMPPIFYGYLLSLSLGHCMTAEVCQKVFAQPFEFCCCSSSPYVQQSSTAQPLSNEALLLFISLVW